MKIYYRIERALMIYLFSKRALWKIYYRIESSFFSKTITFEIAVPLKIYYRIESFYGICRYFQSGLC